METTNQQFEIGQLVTFNGAFGVCKITSIKGKTATVVEQNTQLVYNKRLSALQPYKKAVAYWNEQEMVAPQYKHGEVVYSSLLRDGNGGVGVWDETVNDVVSKSQLRSI